jgi:hypothetical protein
MRVPEGCTSVAQREDGGPSGRAASVKLKRAERGELLQRLRDLYTQADSKREKARVLDELVARTGYHRKHAARLLRSKTMSRSSRRFYDDAVRDALVAAWEASGRVGSRRLKALIPELVTASRNDRPLPRAPGVRAKLLAMSTATIDRLLAPRRAVAIAEQRLARISEAIKSLAEFPDGEERRLLAAQCQRALDAIQRGHVPAEPRGREPPETRGGSPHGSGGRGAAQLSPTRGVKP